MRHPERVFTDYELSPLVGVLARKFINRWDMYPQQMANGRWLTVHEPLHVGLLQTHLRGDVTLGVYLLDEQSRGRFLVFDADSTESWQQLRKMAQELATENVTTYLENSRRGGHLWLFFDQPQPGQAVRWFGRGVLARQGIPPKQIELYPKQDELDDGPGSLIRLPFGVHRKSGQRYGFMTPEGNPLAPTLRQQVQVLGRAETVPIRFFELVCDKGREVEAERRKRRIARPLAATKSVTVGDLPSERIKTAVSVHDFVSQYVELSPSGMGLCPFHDDTHPSFSVNAEENYWYCFTCGIGGSVIDFWMQWQDCDFVTAVSELAHMLYD
ncbi:MAG: hypothetical protein H6667_25480 [Ardenticatenaceae bacterium]|nr:hypothetical protein [Ardenticatenaceae bacterium]